MPVLSDERAPGAALRRTTAIAVLAVALAACAGHGTGSQTEPTSTRSRRGSGATAPPLTSNTVTSTSTTVTTTTSASHRPLLGRVVHIDAGHDGGNFTHLAEIDRPVNIITKTIDCDTTGTEGPDRYTESAFNLNVALRIRRMLESLGAKVVMTRTTDTGWGPCINQRAAIGNRSHADAAISIHADGNDTSGNRGFHVIEPLDVPGHNDSIIQPSERLGRDVRAAFPSTGMPVSNYAGTDGIERRNDLGGLNFSQVPKVFIECGNMHDPTDLALLESPEWRERAALALADAITTFLTSK